MKKICFSDRFRLTDLVLSGQKTMTRRIVPEKVMQEAIDFTSDFVGGADISDEDLDKITNDVTLTLAPFKVGEKVAIAQPLCDMGYNPNDRSDGHVFGLKYAAAWRNKLFVSAKQCKRVIRITDLRTERLQSISDNDIMKEGIRVYEGIGGYGFSYDRLIGKQDGEPVYHTEIFYSRREAFASQIDAVSGKGTWNKNPYVFVYEFELVNETPV